MQHISRTGESAMRFSFLKSENRRYISSSEFLPEFLLENIIQTKTSSRVARRRVRGLYLNYFPCSCSRCLESPSPAATVFCRWNSRCGYHYALLLGHLVTMPQGRILSRRTLNLGMCLRFHILSAQYDLFCKVRNNIASDLVSGSLLKDVDRMDLSFRVTVDAKFAIRTYRR